MFYQSYLALTVLSIVKKMTSLEYFERCDSWLIFTNSLHRCDRSKFLLVLCWLYLTTRSVLTVSSLAVVSMSCCEVTGPVVWPLLCLLCCQCLTVLYETVWLSGPRDKRFTGLMSQYCSFLSKVDVARGRSVPSPLNPAMSEQVLPSLNPYTASPDLKLLLDLLASRAGLGLSLRCLAFLESDLGHSWAPSGLQGEVGEGEVMVYWRDPVVLRYITLSTSGLSLHYGLELEIEGSTQTRIVSHREVNMNKMSWSKSSTNVNMGDSRDFVYQETFHSKAAKTGSKLRVWTIVNGHLISKCEAVIFSVDVPGGSLQSLQSEGGREDFTDCTGTNNIKHQPSKLYSGAQNSRRSPISLSETHLNYCHQQFERNSKIRKSYPVGHWNQSFTPDEGDDCLVI